MWNKKLFKSYIGRYAVCFHGTIGKVEEYEPTPTGQVIWRGRDILTGENWQAVRPRFIDDKVAAKIIEALEKK